MAPSQNLEAEGITRRRSLAALAGAGALALAGCTQSSGGGGSDGGSGDDGSGDDGSGDDGSGDGGDSLSGSINIAGSSTVFPLMSAVMEDFAEEHPGIDPTISSTGSGGGFSNYFCVGETDFNNASRPIQPEEEQLCADNGVEYIELVAATDALTVVVNPEADWIDSLTIEELATIWESDAVETWDEVRDEFPNEEIERYGAADTSGTYDYFIEAVLGERGHTSDYQATEQDNNIATGVAGSEYAIGYFGFAYYFQNPDQLKALGIDSGDGPVEPSLETASSGEYTPLSRPLFTYPSIESLGNEHVAEFARYFVEQTTNEDLVAGDVGYVPATEETQEEQMQKLEDAIEQAQG
ncbi:PstS family phosphate ABC transporter substrate-binding protein [Halorubrum cibi]|uniref:Phosphate ABC transporter substrate-binding protein, PhoT family n=1 Tax=Halorubrum cibi TaxID=413815 RepID=A0A521BKU2_9EURY|nr:PstS family phosphate ABC transporter substrate-binding protein [Halorubrum cibi]SMO47778.1 phosphate ABC transporter substrate-binding protein, PhoT family [Halorubrum cibi]